MLILLKFFDNFFILYLYMKNKQIKQLIKSIYPDFNVIDKSKLHIGCVIDSKNMIITGEKEIYITDEKNLIETFKKSNKYKETNKEKYDILIIYIKRGIVIDRNLEKNKMKHILKNFIDYDNNCYIGMCEGESGCV